MEINEAIRDLRRLLGGISQERLARMLGVTLRTAARWESSSTLAPQAIAQLYCLARETEAVELAEFFRLRLQVSLGLPALTIGAMVIPDKTPPAGDEHETWRARWTSIRRRGRSANGPPYINKDTNPPRTKYN